jgi:hypothetical protein
LQKIEPPQAWGERTKAARNDTKYRFYCSNYDGPVLPHPDAPTRLKDARACPAAATRRGAGKARETSTIPFDRRFQPMVSIYTIMSLIKCGKA